MMNTQLTKPPWRTMIGGVLVAGVGVLGAALLGLGPAEGEDADPAGETPAVVEAVAGSDIPMVTLSARAAERLGVETAAVRRDGRSSWTVMPYGALIYDAQGATWAYASPAALEFQRTAVDVERISGDEVVLRSGPPEGTRVVTVGTTELFGTEFGVGH